VYLILQFQGRQLYTRYGIINNLNTYRQSWSQEIWDLDCQSCQTESNIGKTILKNTFWDVLLLQTLNSLVPHIFARVVQFKITGADRDVDHERMDHFSERLKNVLQWTGMSGGKWCLGRPSIPWNHKGLKGKCNFWVRTKTSRHHNKVQNFSVNPNQVFLRQKAVHVWHKCKCRMPR